MLAIKQSLLLLWTLRKERNNAYASLYTYISKRILHCISHVYLVTLYTSRENILNYLSHIMCRHGISCNELGLFEDCKFH